MIAVKNSWKIFFNFSDTVVIFGFFCVLTKNELLGLEQKIIKNSKSYKKRTNTTTVNPVENDILCTARSEEGICKVN